MTKACQLSGRTEHGVSPCGVGAIRPGDHICCLFETEVEHRAILTAYLRDGLERHEKVIYVMDEHPAESVMDYLRDDGLDAGHYLSEGQLVFVTAGEVYMPRGVFSSVEMLKLLQVETEKALGEGFSGLRGTGEMTWALRGLPGSWQLPEYEKQLTDALAGLNCAVMCQYDLRRFAPQFLMELLETHPRVFIPAGLYENFYFISAGEMAAGGHSAASLRHHLRSLATHARLEVRWKKRIVELQATLSRPKRTEELVPICAWCKKIRDQRGVWDFIENYMFVHFNIAFTHGICPDCASRLTPVHQVACTVRPGRPMAPIHDGETIQISPQGDAEGRAGLPVSGLRADRAPPPEPARDGKSGKPASR